MSAFTKAVQPNQSQSGLFQSLLIQDVAVTLQFLTAGLRSDPGAYLTPISLS